MLLWYLCMSVVLVHVVFRSSGIDYRLVGLGALLPLVVDAPLRRLAYGHSLLVGIALLTVVMLGTVGRSRLLRRRLLCLPIGYLCGLVLSGAWVAASVFWWPFLGALPDEPLLAPFAVVALEEAAGLAASAFAVSRFGLGGPAARSVFLRTGRLREVARR